MSRRVSLPGADALFGERRADEADPGQQPRQGAPDVSAESSAGPTPADLPPRDAPTDASEPAGSTKRVRHDEKITVYMSADELVDLEHARLILRRDFGLAVDRGRIVRESLNLALHGLEAGADSPLVRRLNGSP